MTVKPNEDILKRLEYHREQWNMALDSFVRCTYEIVPPEPGKASEFIIRRSEVYVRAAKKFRIQVVNYHFMKAVKAAVIRCGGRESSYANRQCFTGLRDLEVCAEAAKELSRQLKSDHKSILNWDSPAEGNSRKSGASNETDWEALLKSEGMPPELSFVGLVNTVAGEIKSGLADKALEVLWKLNRDLDIVSMRAQGMQSIRDIAAKTNRSRKVVHTILLKYGLSSANE